MNNLDLSILVNINRLVHVDELNMKGVGKCTCTFADTYGLVHIGHDCRVLNEDRHRLRRVGHTRKTGGRNGEIRKQRCFERSRAANGLSTTEPKKHKGSR